jgi:hypothetical protein
MRQKFMTFRWDDETILKYRRGDFLAVRWEELILHYGN